MEVWTCSSLLIMYGGRPAKRELQKSRPERTRGLEMTSFFVAAVSRRWKTELAAWRSAGHSSCPYKTSAPGRIPPVCTNLMSQGAFLLSVRT